MKRSTWAPAEDIIARKRDQKAHKMHRARLNASRAMVDSSKPASMNMQHLNDRLKKKQLVEDRRAQIDMENSKLIEKMARIMRGESDGASLSRRADSDPRPAPPAGTGQLSAGDWSKVGPLSVNEPVRRRQAARIEAENREIAARLKHQTPNYSHAKMERDYGRSVAFKKNISKAQKRDERAKRYAAWKAQHEDAASTLPGGPGSDTYYNGVPTPGGMSIEEASADLGYGETLRGGASTIAPNLVLRTARQVRAEVARARGHDAPDHPTASSEAAARASGPAERQQIAVSGRYKLKINHSGSAKTIAPSAAEDLMLPPSPAGPGQPGGGGSLGSAGSGGGGLAASAAELALR